MEDLRQLEMEKYAAWERLRLCEAEFEAGCERLSAAVAGLSPFDYWLRRKVNEIRERLGLRGRI